MPEKSEFDKALGELHDLTEWEDAEAAIRELHAREPEIERLYLDSKILPGELRALVMVSNCLEREFIHRQLATGQPLHMNVLWLLNGRKTTFPLWHRRWRTTLLKPARTLFMLALTWSCPTVRSTFR